MRKISLFLTFVCSMQMMALNLVVEHRSGADLLQDIAIIGKLVYVGDELQLLDNEGDILATEPLDKIKKITFFVHGPVTNIENMDTNSILIYPNPTRDVLMIEGVDSQTLRVYDLQGRLIKKENSTQVDVSNLAEGTYLLQIGTQVVRFIKK
jgi:hypothetical protein